MAGRPKTEPKPVTTFQDLLDQADQVLRADKIIEQGPPEIDEADLKGFIRAYYSGSYQVPSKVLADKRDLKKFEHIEVLVPEELLVVKHNFQVYLLNHHEDDFRRHDPDFIKFHRIYFLYARYLDGSVINDPRTFSIDELVLYCKARKWPINFNLAEFSGYKLRNIVDRFFLQPVPQIEAFKKHQEKLERKQGLTGAFEEKLKSVHGHKLINFNSVSTA